MTAPSTTDPGTTPLAGDPPSNAQSSKPAPDTKPQGDPVGPTAEDVQKLQQALDRERSLRKDAERAAKEGAAHKAKLDELAEASKSDIEKAVDAARKEGAAQALATANARLVASEARALAAEVRFRDPGDAVRFLDLGDVKVTDDGTVDAAAISKQLEQLAKDKPYLIVEQQKPVPTPAQAGIGVGGEPSRALQPGMDRLRAAYGDTPPARSPRR